MNDRKNINRGYQKLIVWQDAANLYLLTCKIFGKFQYELRRVGVNQIASVDSVHRNIAEGYCRRSLNEYLQFLNIALASLGESFQVLTFIGKPIRSAKRNSRSGTLWPTNSRTESKN